MKSFKYLGSGAIGSLNISSGGFLLLVGKNTQVSSSPIRVEILTQSVFRFTLYKHVGKSRIEIHYFFLCLCLVWGPVILPRLIKSDAFVRIVKPWSGRLSSDKTHRNEVTLRAKQEEYLFCPCPVEKHPQSIWCRWRRF